MKDQIEQHIERFIRDNIWYNRGGRAEIAKPPDKFLWSGKLNVVFSKKDFINALNEMLYETIKPENVFFEDFVGTGYWCYKSVRHPDVLIRYGFYEHSGCNKYTMEYKSTIKPDYKAELSLYRYQIETKLSIQFDRNFEFVDITLRCRKQNTTNQFNFVKFKNPKNVDWEYFEVWWDKVAAAAEKQAGRSKFFN